MTKAALLAAEIDVFSAIIDELVDIAGHTVPDRRSELMKLCRRLSGQIGRLR